MDLNKAPVKRGVRWEYRFDAVIHFVGLKEVGKSLREPLMYYNNKIIKKNPFHHVKTNGSQLFPSSFWMVLLTFASLRIRWEYRFDAVIHFVGLKEVGESVREPLMDYNNKIIGSITLLEVMVSYGCNKTRTFLLKTLYFIDSLKEPT